jgi:flagellar protein FliO/FliZ
MFDSLSEMPNAMKAVVILVFVIVGIVVVGLLLRRFAGDRFGATTARNRQPRLGMVDSVDLPFGRRQLLIVRRDNVEHLLMIGGPTDVVIEQNIVRASGAPREKIEPTLGRGMASENLPRPVPLGEPTPFPLQPQAENNGRAPRIPEEPAQWTWPTQAEPERPARPEPRLEARPAPRSEAINAPSSDFSPRPVTPREPSFTRPVTPPVSRPVPTPPMAAPAAATPVPVVTPPATPAPTPATAPIVKVGIDEKIMANAGPDQNLSDMANMLEAALRRPNEPRFSEASMSMKTEPMAPPPPRFTPPEPKPQAKAEPKQQAPADTKSAAPKAVYDSLEEEMASLLGRPPGKP